MLSLIAFGLFQAGADPKSAPLPKLEIVQVHSGGVSTPAIYHIFGGQPVQLDMALGGSTGTVDVRVDVFQKARSLFAPLEKDLEVGKITPCGGETVMWQWMLSVPEVKRETEMLVRFRVGSPVPPGAAGNPNWQPAGETVFKVYPKDPVKDDLAQLAKERQIHVFGDSKLLRAFLNSQEVQFDDDGAELPDLSDSQKLKTVYLGSAPSVQLTHWLADHSGTTANVVVFCQDSDLLPGIYPAAQGGFRSVKVTLPVLDTLATDPRSQKTLLEILNLIKTDPN